MNPPNTLTSHQPRDTGVASFLVFSEGDLRLKIEQTDIYIYMTRNQFKTSHLNRFGYSLHAQFKVKNTSNKIPYAKRGCCRKATYSSQVTLRPTHVAEHQLSHQCQGPARATNSGQIAHAFMQLQFTWLLGRVGPKRMPKGECPHCP